jgi:riboflavin kinase/FMN adenylyltransferase
MDCMPPLAELVVHARTGRWRRGAGAALAVGNFDGVHVGHAEIARRLRAAADRQGVPAVALTFDPHPAAIVRPASAPVPLTTPDRRAALLLDLGLDAVLVQPADRGLVELAAHDFYRHVLRGRLQAAALVEGADFRFGAGRAGDVAVSSSRIRGMVAAGEIGAANRLLTAPLRVSGTVVVGARRGAQLGFPTANLADIATLLPREGVYAARAGVAGGASWPAAVHIGPNASFGETALSVEVHLIGFAGDLYGRRLDVDFLERLRDTRRFAAVDDLIAQMTADVAAAARIAAAGGPATGSDHAT